MSAKLNEQEIQEKLKGLNGWVLQGNQIEKQYAFKDFREGIAFLIRVAFFAEEMDHHPDIEIRYNKVFLKLTTHSAGGITEKDFHLAQRIDSINLP